MAANVGISFLTPEEYFLQEEARPFAREFDPMVYLEQRAAESTAARTSGMSKPHGESRIANFGIKVPTPFSKTHSVEIVLFCGSPGAGKSSFYWRHLEPLGYARVNQDILKTVSKLGLPKGALEARVVRPMPAS